MSDTDLQIVLCDFQSQLVRAWDREFADSPNVVVLRGDLLDMSADAYVSPANSYGWMDGGIDLALRERFGAGDIQARVHEAIAERGGVLPVGQAIVVETADDDVPYLVVAPTMEVPMTVAHTDHAYRAMAALLLAIAAYNLKHADAIGTVAIPGLCTGVGGMEADMAARQMRRAYQEWIEQ